jgi:hypothetical protein
VVPVFGFGRLLVGSREPSKIKSYGQPEAYAGLMHGLNLGASVNGKPTVSKTVTAGSSPAAPEFLIKVSERLCKGFLKLWVF